MAMTQKELKEKILQNDDRMSKAELEKTLAEIEVLEKQLLEQEAIAKDADPYWHYLPSSGDVSKEAREFLSQYLKSEDIPQKLAGQIDVHQSLAPVIGASGGNQSGKTTVGAIEAFIKTTGELPMALEGKYPVQKLPKKFPQHVRVIGEDYVNGILLNLIPTYRKWVPREFLFGGTWEKSFSSEQSLLKIGRKGQLTGTIEFMSNKQDVGSFQGPARHKMIYDEEPRRDIRQENLLRFTTADSLDELYCMTPTKGMSWVYDELYQKFIDGDTDHVNWFQLPSVGNLKANLKVLAEILKDIPDYDTRKMRLLGEFISLAGLIYGKLFDRRIHVVAPFELDADWVVFRGLDPHTAKPSVCTEVAVNREGQYVICGVYKKAVDTEELKRDLAARARERKYRLGWTRCDKSANTTNKLLQNLNIFRLLQRGDNAIPALFESDKFTGSIHAGVDVIKTLLKVGPSQKPGLMIFDLPETRELQASFQSLEREQYPNEDERGLKDKIAEGKHDAHAALRYVFQGTPRWYPPADIVPELEPASELTGY